MTVDNDRAHNIAAFRAARDWADQHGHTQPDDRMLKAYGRALLAALGHDEPADTRTEYGVRLTFDDGHTEDHMLHPLNAAQARVAFHRRRRAEVPGWRAANAEVIERTVTKSAWTLHTQPAPEAAGDAP